MATKTLLFLVILAISQLAFAEEEKTKNCLKRKLNSYQQNFGNAVRSAINENRNKEGNFINLGINTIKKIVQFGNGQGKNAGIGLDSQGIGRLPSFTNLGEEGLNVIEKSVQTGVDVANQIGQNAHNSVSPSLGINIDRGSINLTTPQFNANMGGDQGQEGGEGEVTGQSQGGGQSQGMGQDLGMAQSQGWGQGQLERVEKSRNRDHGKQDRLDQNNWGGFFENLQTRNGGVENEFGKSTNKIMEAKNKMVGQVINELQGSIHDIEKHQTEFTTSVCDGIGCAYEEISNFISKMSSDRVRLMKSFLSEHFENVNKGRCLMKQKSTEILNNGQEMGNKIVNHVKDQMYMMPDRLSTMLEGVKHNLEDCLSGDMDINKFCEFLELNLTKFNKDKCDEFNNMTYDLNVRSSNEIVVRKQYIINYFNGENSQLTSSAEKRAKFLSDSFEEIRSIVKDLDKNGVFTNIMPKVIHKTGKMNMVKRDMMEPAMDNLIKTVKENLTNSKDFGKAIDDAKSKVKGILIEYNEVIRNSINDVKNKVENKIEECKHVINKECDHLKDSMQPSKDMVKSLVFRIRDKIIKLKHVKSDTQQEILDYLRGQLRQYINTKKHSFIGMAHKVTGSLSKYLDEGKVILNSLCNGKDKTIDFILGAEFKINEIGETLKNKCSSFANNKNQFITTERNKMSKALADLIKKKNDLIIKIREGAVDVDGNIQNDVVNSIKPQVDKVKNSLGSFKKKNDVIIDSLQNLIDKLSQLKNKKESLPDKVFDSVKTKLDDWADSMNKEIKKKISDGKTDDMIPELNNKLKVWKEELLKQLVDQMKPPANKKENDFGDIGAQLQTVKDKCASNGKETFDEVMDTVDNLNEPLSSAIKNKLEAPSDICGPAKKKIERYAKNFFRQLGVKVCPCPKYFK